MTPEDVAAAAPGPLELAPRRAIRGPLDMLRLITDSPLRAGLKLFAVVLVRRVDNDTWSWPAKPDSSRPQDHGISVQRLADDMSCTKKTVQRCMKELEQQGLARRFYRGGRTNGYKLLVEAWADFAQVFDAERARQDAATEERRLAEATEAWLKGTGVDALRDDPGVDLDEPGEEAHAAESSLPRWVFDRAQFEGQDPQHVYALVAALVSLVAPKADPRSMGGISKCVMRLWRSRAYPSVAELVHQVRLMVRAAAHAPAWHWRNLRERGWGELPLKDLRYLMAPSRFAERLQSAQEWAADVDADLDQPGTLRRLLSGAGALPWPPAQAPTRWAAVMDQAEQRLGEIDAAIWLRQGVVGVELVEGVLWLEAVSEVHADWIEQEYGQLLAELLGGPLGLAWPSG